MSCQACHEGPADHTFETMEEAHVGMVADPSATGACDGCHADIAAATANSLHTNLWGEVAVIERRGRCTLEGAYREGFDAKCNTCHTTCGQCHISRPNSVGGGFIVVAERTYSHRFRNPPDMNEQCTACHGSRIGADFKGEIEGNLPDVHRARKCEGCHTAEEIHGDSQHEGDHYNHRYEVATMPRCESCHDDLEANSYHNAHVDGFVGSANLQCQVCHSQPYKNCTNCHNLGAGEAAKYDIEPSRIQFKIGRNLNANRSEYDYVVVRHVPVDEGTFADWGLDLPGYLDEPTWLYASPHNILRHTPQTTVADGASCGASCHGSDEYFLREADLYAADGVTPLPDYQANLDVVVPDDR
jgi:thiosulfate/3-mercaptopyruvate sulfurtransferase